MSIRFWSKEICMLICLLAVAVSFPSCIGDDGLPTLFGVFVFLMILVPIGSVIVVVIVNFVSKGKMSEYSHDFQEQGRVNNNVPFNVSISTRVEQLTPDFDESEEGSFWDVDKPFRVSSVLNFDYTAASGKKTNRTVEVRQIGAARQGALLIGFCRLRNDMRTFRIDRISECSDAETGEVIDNVYSYLQKRFECSAQFSVARLYAEEFDTLRVLIYAAKADGRFTVAEKKIVCDLCKNISNDNRLDVDDVRYLYGEIKAPSRVAFELSVDHLSSKPVEYKKRLIDAVERMISSDKKIHPEETAALNFIYQHFFPSGV
jgi:hypothetical protein